MLDIRYIREHAEEVQKNAQQKGYNVAIDELLKHDATRLKLQREAEALRERRNDIASRMKGGKPSPDGIAEGKVIKEKLSTVEETLKEVEVVYLTLLKQVPNMALPDVPIGASEDENVIAKTVGEPTEFDFIPKNHWQLAETKGWIDKERAAKVAGSRFAYIKGDLVRLQWAMMQFGMDVLGDEKILKQIIADNNLKVSSKPFVPVQPPALIRTEVYEATARLDGEEVTYKLADDELWLNASAEHSLSPMYQNEILNEADLPIRYVGYLTSFRREAGTYGKDMEGIFRLHQFDKLEMESFAAPETSYDEHLFMVAIEEYVMTKLKVPYRVLQKCTADIGGPNARGVDIECWLPGQNQYRETHSADLITDYQARRLNTRFRREGGSIDLVHTNDATVFSQRPLIAILENFQTAEGDVIIPEVLRPYMGGKAKI